MPLTQHTINDLETNRLKLKHVSPNLNYDVSPHLYAAIKVTIESKIVSFVFDKRMSVATLHNKQD